MKSIRAASIWVLLLFLGACLTLPLRIHAQASASGTLSGTTQDANDAILPGVSVTVKNTGTSMTRTTTSDSEGRWTIPVLPVGTYEVIYELNGFKKLLRHGVEVEAAVTRTLEDKLETGVHIYRLRQRLAPFNLQIETKVCVGYCLKRNPKN
jgi:hypothetical protein